VPRPRTPSPRPAKHAATPEPPLGLVVAAPLAAAAIVHGAGIGGFFAADDLDFLARARGLDPTPWSWARPLPGMLRWRAFTALFGVHALPHLLLAWLLHALAALLVARVALQAGMGRWAALAAGVLAGSTAIAYTSTHWASGLGEVMAAAFALGALTLHLECRRRTSARLAWLAGACAIGAVASKESTLLLPVAVWAFDALGLAPGEGRGARREIALCGGAAAIAVVAAYVAAPHLAGEAYALDFSPRGVGANLLTYGAWLVRVLDPIRDRTAAAQPRLAPWGLALFAAWAAAAWAERRRASRPVTAGLAWFLLFLAPVAPLARHTYLYYLVVPFAGAALAAGALLARGAARLPAPAGPWALALLLGAGVANDARQLKARVSLQVGGVRVDRVARESGMVRNALADLAAAHVAAGDTIALVNPFPILAYDPTTGRGHAAGPNSYLPVVAALRHGAALRLFLPGVTVLGMGDDIPPAWARARVFRYDNDGRLYDQGRGVVALDSLATDYLLGERFAEARATLARVIAQGSDGPELRWRLVCALSGLGQDSAAVTEARRLVARWPDSPRARKLVAEDEAHAAAARAGR